jgi:threonine dehydrogenase-like Zn-dependent dehydrogenase
LFAHFDVQALHALWLENRQLRLRDDLPVPKPATGEALVHVRLAGICATDLELTRGYYPFAGVPGHEFVGEIATAPGAPQRVGERVVGEINIGCGKCDACLASRRNHCERRKVLGIRDRNGAFSRYLTLPLANLLRVPERIPDEIAVFCEPLAAALRIQDQRPIVPGERVLLVGAGRLGQLIALTLAPMDCRLTVVARHPSQKELLEAAEIAWIDEENVQGRGYDLVVEASGSPGGFDLARRCVRPGGTLVLKSTYANAAQVDLSRLVVDEVTLLGSRCGTFAPALDLLQRGLADPRPLIEARYPLNRAVEAFERAARPGALKILVECGQAQRE